MKFSSNFSISFCGLFSFSSLLSCALSYWCFCFPVYCHVLYYVCVYFPAYCHMVCYVCVYFPVYCHVLCVVCQQLPVDPMIVQPILEELDSSLQRCFTQEAEGLYTLQKERKNLQLLAAGVASVSSGQMALSLSFDGEIPLSF